MTVCAAASFRHAVKSAAPPLTGLPIRAGQRAFRTPRRRCRTHRCTDGNRSARNQLTGYRARCRPACRTRHRAGRPTGRQPGRPAPPRSGKPRGWSAETTVARGKRSRKTNAPGPADDTRSGLRRCLITPTAAGRAPLNGCRGPGPDTARPGRQLGVLPPGTRPPQRRGRKGQPARSAALRSTQNSLPSISASVTHPVPSARRWSATRVAPSASSRSTSSSRSRSCG